MSWIPGWNSIASAHWWSNVYFAASIGALILLGVFEVISHRYSERKDELAAIEQTDTERRHEEEITRLHRDADRLKADAEASRAQIADAQARVAEATQKAAEATLALEKLKAPRKLTPEQEADVVGSIKAFAGVPFTIGLFNQPEALDLMAQLERVLAAAGWVEGDWKGSGDTRLSRPGKPSLGFTSVAGVFVQADKSHLADFGPAVVALAAALTKNGVAATPQVGNMPPDPAREAIQILIGKKPL